MSISKINDPQDAATVLQRYIRGYHTRSRIIFPIEIRPSLNKLKGLGDQGAKVYACIIAQQSFDMFIHPDRFEYGMRHSTYPYPLKWGRFLHLKLPKVFWMGFSEDKKSLCVQIYQKTIQNAVGTYKHYKESDTLIIGLDGGPQKTIKTEKTVLGRSNEPISKKDRSIYTSAHIAEEEIDTIDIVYTGLRFTTVFFPEEERAKNPQIKIVDYPRNIRFHYSKKSIRKLEWEETKYLFDLDHGIQQENISYATRIKIVHDMFTTLSFLHQKGIAHRDVKPRNILLKKDAVHGFEGFLTDFDLTDKWGQEEFEAEEDYTYWDVFSLRGIILPTTDLFGLTTTLGELFFGIKTHELPPLWRSKKFLPRCYKKIEILCDNFIQAKAKKILYSPLFNKISFDHLMPLELTLSKSTLAKILPLINKEFNQLASLCPEAATSIQNVLNELKACVLVSQLLKDLYAADCEVKEYTSSAGCFLFIEHLESCSLDEQITLIQDLYEKFPFYKNLGAKLQELVLIW